MTQKEELAQFISASKHDPTQWRMFANKHSFIRVKEVGSNGDVLISLEKGDSWIKPIDWLINYKNSCKSSTIRELERMKNITSKEEVSEILREYVVHEVPQPSVVDNGPVVKKIDLLRYFQQIPPNGVYSSTNLLVGLLRQYVSPEGLEVIRRNVQVNDECRRTKQSR